MSREAMQQALEALETCSDTSLNTGEDFVMTHVYDEDKVAQALVTLRAALAEPEQEPDTDCHAQGICQRSGYSISAPRKPVELTESEIAHASASSKACVSVAHGERVAFARAVIAAYEAKQGGQT